MVNRLLGEFISKLIKILFFELQQGLVGRKLVSDSRQVVPRRPYGYRPFQYRHPLLLTSPSELGPSAKPLFTCFSTINQLL